jgi:hypothetical protein
MRTEIQLSSSEKPPIAITIKTKRMKPGRAIVWVIGIWDLEFVWDLVLGAWNFSLTSS